MIEHDPDLVQDICRKAKDIVGHQKLGWDDQDGSNDNYAVLQADPDFLAHALLFKNMKEKKDNRGTKGDVTPITSMVTKY